MSQVTNVIFSHSILEDDYIMGVVNDFFGDTRMDKPLISCDDNHRVPIGWYGGSKMLEARVYIGAFNYFNIGEFMKHLKLIDWEFPEYVQLIIQEDGDEQFRIIQMTGWKDD